MFSMLYWLFTDSIFNRWMMSSERRDIKRRIRQAHHDFECFEHWTLDDVIRPLKIEKQTYERFGSDFQATRVAKKIEDAKTNLNQRRRSHHADVEFLTRLLELSECRGNRNVQEN